MDSLTSLTYSMGLVFLAGTIENSTKYLCEPNFMKNLHCCKQEVCIFVVAFLSLYYLKKKNWVILYWLCTFYSMGYCQALLVFVLDLLL